MTWDLATAKADLGIPPHDTSKDAAIQRQMDAVLAIVETYCSRRFLFARGTQYFAAPHREVLSLARYPLDTIYSVTCDGYFGAGSVQTRIVQPNTGLITATFYGSELGCSLWWGNVTVDYDGGYQELPPDLEMAMWEMFYLRWNASGGTGSMTDIGAAISLDGVRSITIPNVISTTMGGGSASQGSGAGPPSIAGLTQAYAPILDLYRRIVV